MFSISSFGVQTSFCCEALLTTLLKEEITAIELEENSKQHLTLAYDGEHMVPCYLFQTISAFWRSSGIEELADFQEKDDEQTSQPWKSCNVCEDDSMPSTSRALTDRSKISYDDEACHGGFAFVQVALALSIPFGSYTRSLQAWKEDTN